MKKIALVFVLTGFLAASCSNTGKTSAKPSQDSDSLSTEFSAERVGDSIVIDTVITNIDIDGTSFFASVFRRKYDEKHQLLTDENLCFSPIELAIFRPDTKQTSFFRKFKQGNMFSIFKNGQSSLNLPGQVYCSLVMYGGGSGFAATLFRVNKDGGNKIKLMPAFEYGELTCFAISKNDSSILRVAGFWDFDENETHFEHHRYRVYKYLFQGDSYKQIELGMTKHKYSSGGDETMKEIVEKMKTDEPDLFQSVDLSNYNFKEFSPFDE